MVRVIIATACAVVLAGCATGSQVHDLTTQNQQLQARVGELQSQLQQRDDEIRDMSSRISDTYSEARDPVRKTLKATPKRIQAALKAAGFYAGAVDGKIGKKTRESIRKFQRDNGLKADGIVGAQTWDRLSEYCTAG